MHSGFFDSCLINLPTELAEKIGRVLDLKITKQNHTEYITLEKDMRSPSKKDNSLILSPERKDSSNKLQKTVTQSNGAKRALKKKKKEEAFAMISKQLSSGLIPTKCLEALFVQEDMKVYLVY